MMLFCIAGAMRHAVSACQDLSGLIYVSVKIGDVPGFTVGLLDFSYHGWLRCGVCLHDDSPIKSLDPET